MAAVGNKASQLTTEQVRDEIVQHLRHRIPWLMMRLGDGEALAFASEGHDVMAEKENIPWRKHLGILPSDEEKREWRILTEVSARCADLVGLHPTDSTQGKQFGHSGKTLRGMIGPLFTRECAANIHLDLMRSGAYADIIRAARGVMLVTGHTVQSSGTPLMKAFRKEFMADKGPGLLKMLQLPLQSCYFELKTPWNWWTLGMLPQIKEMPRMPGWLVLFGGGIPGKAVLWALKERGAVIVDIGSVFDRWAGFATRGKGKGVKKPNEADMIGKPQEEE